MDILWHFPAYDKGQEDIRWLKWTYFSWWFSEEASWTSRITLTFVIIKDYLFLFWVFFLCSPERKLYNLVLLLPMVQLIQRQPSFICFFFFFLPSSLVPKRRFYHFSILLFFFFKNTPNNQTLKCQFPHVVGHPVSGMGKINVLTWKSGSRWSFLVSVENV